MKNPHDPLEDELKKRLDKYSEEPDDALWSRIESTLPKPAWVKPAIWTSSIVLILISAFFVVYQITDNTADDTLISESKSENKIEKVDPSETGNSAAALNPGNAEESAPEATQTEVNRNLKSNQGIEGRSNEKTTKARNQTSTNELVTKSHENEQPVNKNIVTTEDNQENVGSKISNDHKDVNDVNSATKSQTSPETKSATFSKNENSIADDQNVIETPVVTNSDPGNHADAPGKTTLIQSEGAKTIGKDSSKRVVVEAVTAVSSQSKNDEEKPKDDKKETDKKLSLYFTAMPTFGYQRIESNKNDNVLIESVEKISKFSTKRLGIRAELGAEYRITRRTKVFGGLLYYQRKQTINYIEKTVTNVVEENVIDTVVVLDPQLVSQGKTFDYEVRNLGIQVGVNYTIKEGKFLHSAGTGIEFHKSLTKAPDADKTSVFGSNPSTYVFYNLYYRLQYPAKGKLKAVFQPTFNYSLYLNQDMNAPFYVKPYGLGVNLGLTYSF